MQQATELNAVLSPDVIRREKCKNKKMRKITKEKEERGRYKEVLRSRNRKEPKLVAGAVAVIKCLAPAPDQPQKMPP